MSVRAAALPLFAAALCLGAAVAGAQQIEVTVNGSRVHFEDTQPRMIEGRVLVPLRGVLEKMGAQVGWDQQSQTVTADRGHMELTLPIGSHTAEINGRQVSLDVPAMVIDGSTLVPLRFVSQALGADVAWSSDTDTVAINVPDMPDRGVRYRAHVNVPEPTPAPEESAPDRVRRTIPAGSVIPVTLDSDLSSSDERDGEEFTATIHDGNDWSGLPEGTKVAGVIREAIPARNGRPGVLDLQVKTIVFPDGGTRSVAAAVSGMGDRFVRHRNDGRIVAWSGINPNDRVKWIGIGEDSGVVVSTTQSGSMFVDSVIDGNRGALLGELRREGAHNVHLAPGTEFGVRLVRDFSFTHTND